MATVAQNPEQPAAAPQTQYKRFGAGQRFEHIVLLVTFTGLALTGLPQTYAHTDIGRGLIALMGGIESIRIVHRVLATILMAESIYHGGILSYKAFVLGRRAAMLPGLRDMRDAINWVLYNLGFRAEHPHMPRYNFGEKAEYLAVVWGTIIMVITGFMMWNPIAASRLLPGEFIPAARAAHAAEAVLAVVSILIWHMWNVHIRRFNRSMFTGNLPRAAMEEEHAEELAAIERGEPMFTNPPEVVAQRKRYFFPYAFVMTTLLVAGLYWFVTLETTAITTLPERSTSYTTDIDPTTGDAESGAIVWVEQECAVCHGANADAQEIEVGFSIVEREITFAEFITATRLGPAEMPAYPVSTLSDENIAHLWAWFQSLQS
jgi:cytochrome b subunit of formate dehydrogenase/mono/diheme cytochrome c family protein